MNVLVKEIERTMRVMTGNPDWQPPRIQWEATPLLSKVREIARAKAKAEKELQNLPVKRADEIRAKLAEALLYDTPEMMKAEGDRLAAELDKERARVADWKSRHRAEVDADVHAAERRFRAMTAEELRAESLRVMNQDVYLRAEELDALSCELRAVAPDDHKILRDAIKRDGLADEARFTEAGAQIIQQLSAMDKPGYHGGAIPAVYDDGRIVAMPLDMILTEASNEV